MSGVRPTCRCRCDACCRHSTLRALVFIALADKSEHSSRCGAGERGAGSAVGCGKGSDGLHANAADRSSSPLLLNDTRHYRQCCRAGCETATTMFNTASPPPGTHSPPRSRLALLLVPACSLDTHQHSTTQHSTAQQSDDACTHAVMMVANTSSQQSSIDSRPTPAAFIRESLHRPPHQVWCAAAVPVTLTGGTREWSGLMFVVQSCVRRASTRHS